MRNASMERTQLEKILEPALAKLREKAAISDHLLNKDHYTINLTTMWVNLVLEVDELGLRQADLETSLEVFNEIARPILGGKEPVIDAFKYLTTSDGEAAMVKEKLPKRHQQMLLYFASIILDPEGHKRWMKTVEES